MQHDEFQIGTIFFTTAAKWRCTDVGTRTIAAIRLAPVELNIGTLTEQEADAAGWFEGPPFALADFVFDEYDMEGCYADLSEVPD